MKKIILSVLLLISVTICKSQIKLVELKIFDAKYILSNVIEFKSHSFTNYHVMTYIFTNESGSAHEEGTDTVSSSILIVKSEFGEHEIPKFYMVKNVLMPTIISIKENQIIVGNSNGKLNKTYTF